MSLEPTPKHLHVLMAGAHIGVLDRLPSGQLDFSYDDAWMAAESMHVPLSFSMPLAAKTHRGKVVENFLWNLLPDNRDTLQAWGRIHGVRHTSPFALLSRVGEDCAGAVQIVDDEWFVRDNPHHGRVTYIDEAEIGARLKRLRIERTWTGRRTADKGQFSLAGAQPKIALWKANGVWGVPWGRIGTTHILKPPMPQWDGTTENEYACLKLAAALGLRTAEAEVGHFDGETAIVVTRYDRTIDQHNRVRRYHQEDLCQALNVHPGSKYETDGGPNAAAVAAVLRQTSEGETAVKGFAQALALNFLIGGTDAHAKNYSIVHAAGRKSFLAPLYDVMSYLPYVKDADDFRDVRMAMKVGGYYEFDKIMPRHWERQAKAMRIDEEEMVATVADLAERIPDELSKVKAGCEEQGVGHHVLDRFLDVAAARCERVFDLYGRAAAPALG